MEGSVTFRWGVVTSSWQQWPVEPVLGRNAAGESSLLPLSCFWRQGPVTPLHYETHALVFICIQAGLLSSYCFWIPSLCPALEFIFFLFFPRNHLPAHCPRFQSVGINDFHSFSAYFFLYRWTIFMLWLYFIFTLCSVICFHVVGSVVPVLSTGSPLAFHSLVSHCRNPVKHPTVTHTAL